MSLSRSHVIYTHYHNSNLIWHTVSSRVDEVIPSNHPRRVALRVIQWHGLICETWYCTPDQVTIMITCLLYAFFWHYSDFITSFGNTSRKIAWTFAIMLCFLTSRHHVFHLWFHAWNLLYVASLQKQVTNVSLVLKDSDTESENLSSLILLSVSDAQKTDSLHVVSFKGI